MTKRQRIQLLPVFLTVFAVGFFSSMSRSIADETSWLSLVAIYMNPVNNCTDLTVSKDRLPLFAGRRFYWMAARSMLPTIHAGDYVLAITPSEKNPPKPGDLIVFNRIRNDKIVSQSMYRLIGTAGDKILVKQGVVTINGQQLRRTYRRTILGKGYPSQIKYKMFNEALSNGAKYQIMERVGGNSPYLEGIFDVPSDSLFVLGDNRYNAMDSRYKRTGYVSRTDVVGLIVCIAHKER